MHHIFQNILSAPLILMYGPDSFLFVCVTPLSIHVPSITDWLIESLTNVIRPGHLLRPILLFSSSKKCDEGLECMRNAESNKDSVSTITWFSTRLVNRHSRLEPKISRDWSKIFEVIKDYQFYFVINHESKCCSSEVLFAKNKLSWTH